jgi:hypothetical protein
MALFENPNYQYRETYFILFEKTHRPSARLLHATLKSLGNRYEIRDEEIVKDYCESLTIISASDFAALDLVYVEGEEVIAQIKELQEQFKTISITGDDLPKLSRLSRCNARFDLYHFESMLVGEDEALDPGALLIIMEKITDLTGGIGVDPQTTSLM